MSKVSENRKLSKINEILKLFITVNFFKMMGCQISILRVKSCSVVSNFLRPYRLQPTRLLCPWDSPGKNAGVGCHALLQRIFPTQRSNPSLPHCRRILYCLSHQRNPRILEWVVYPFSRGSSRTRNCTRVSSIAGRFFTS